MRLSGDAGLPEELGRRGACCLTSRFRAMLEGPVRRCGCYSVRSAPTSPFRDIEGVVVASTAHPTASMPVRGAGVVAFIMLFDASSLDFDVQELVDARRWPRPSTVVEVCSSMMAGPVSRRQDRDRRGETPACRSVPRGRNTRAAFRPAWRGPSRGSPRFDAGLRIAHCRHLEIDDLDRLVDGHVAVAAAVRVMESLGERARSLWLRWPGPERLTS